LNIVNVWSKKTQEEALKVGKFSAKIVTTKALIADLVSEKLAKQSEIADLQEQIDQIIADDIAVAATDPTVLVAAQEAAVETAKLEQEGRQRNLVIAGVVLIILVIGTIVVIRST